MREWRIVAGQFAQPVNRRLVRPDPPAGPWAIRWLVLGYNYGFCDRKHCWRLPYTGRDGRRWRGYQYITPQVKRVEHPGSWQVVGERWMKAPGRQVRYVTYLLRRDGQVERFSQRQLAAARLLARNPAYVPAA